MGNLFSKELPSLQGLSRVSSIIKTTNLDFRLLTICEFFQLYFLDMIKPRMSEEKCLGGDCTPTGEKRHKIPRASGLVVFLKLSLIKANDVIFRQKDVSVSTHL